MASNVIDLDRAEQAASSLMSDYVTEQQPKYQPKTIKEAYSIRHQYLPIFPATSSGPANQLLLANVLAAELTPGELARRQHGADTSDALAMMNNYKFSAYEGFTLSEQDAEELAARLRVGLSIITFNAERLRGLCAKMLPLHEFVCGNLSDGRYVASSEPALNSKQMACLLEFYLQMDVDVFWMKTCSFRGADPSGFINEGLFYDKDEPQGRYTMAPCGQQSCPCCQQTNDQQTNQSSSMIDFASSAMHRFANGYTTYLNCPTTCTAKNVVYTMTCPCGQYDYVDSTPATLADALAYHRQRGNRIIHEKLTGCPLFPGVLNEPYEREKAIANKMRLYQHAARCPAALRSFLGCNPDYECFVPLLWHDAEAENIAAFLARNVPRQHIIDVDAASIIAVVTTGSRQVTFWLDRVPLPPAAYAFSYEQRRQQRAFFQRFLASPLDQLPYSPVDVYKVATIAVLPEDCSRILRYLVQTLFSVHGETKLNMICPIGGCPERRYGRPFSLVWCANLNRPFVVTTPSSTRR